MRARISSHTAAPHGTRAAQHPLAPIQGGRVAPARHCCTAPPHRTSSAKGPLRLLFLLSGAPLGPSPTFAPQHTNKRSGTSQPLCSQTPAPAPISLRVSDLQFAGKKNTTTQKQHQERAATLEPPAFWFCPPQHPGADWTCGVPRRQHARARITRRARGFQTHEKETAQKKNSKRSK